jgi:hypothetical protein
VAITDKRAHAQDEDVVRRIWPAVLHTQDAHLLPVDLADGEDQVRTRDREMRAANDDLKWRRGGIARDLRGASAAVRMGRGGGGVRRASRARRSIWQAARTPC